jgi:serine phosphatase RsbU (regulator of sigma subunit)
MSNFQTPSPQKWLSVIFLSLIIFTHEFSHAQSGIFTDEERAKYICGFIRQITWPGNETKLTIGILESDTKFSDELRKKAIPENLRDKTLNLISLRSLDDLPKLHLLFVNKMQYPDVKLESLMAVAEANKFLFITEAALFRQSMINFVALNNKTYYEVNEQVLQKAGFKYMSILPLGAIKNKEDWEALFKETKQELDLLKVDYDRLQKEIAAQKQEIARQEKVIADNRAELVEMANEIERRREVMRTQREQLRTLVDDIAQKQEQLRARDREMNAQAEMIIAKQKELEEQNSINDRYFKEIEDKKAQIGGLNTQINGYLATLRMQNVIMILGAMLLIFLAAFGIYVYLNYRKNVRMNRMLQAQHREILEQRDRIAHQNKEITDSIIAARRIQRAILPKHKILENQVDMFIFYRPRDIVSGDFYWMSKKEDKLIIVAADCTGHGVPGAFMSMLGVAFLNEIVNKENEVYANEILNKLRDHVVNSLNQSFQPSSEQSEEHAKEGMDIALCVIDRQTLTLQYAGAYNPLIMIRGDELSEIKADKMPVAYSDYHGDKAFTNNLITLVPGDCIYMFSDGYADQFGGSDEKTKKFSSKRLKASLLEVSALPMNEQEKAMTQHHDNWKGNNIQIDDVLLIGIRI